MNVSKDKKGGTFVVHIDYCENSTWQGELFWAEKNLVKRFQSVLELLKFIDRISGYSQKFQPDHRTTDYAYKISKSEGGVEA